MFFACTMSPLPLKKNIRPKLNTKNAEYGKQFFLCTDDKLYQIAVPDLHYLAWNIFPCEAVTCVWVKGVGQGPVRQKQLQTVKTVADCQDSFLLARQWHTVKSTAASQSSSQLQLCLLLPNLSVVRGILTKQEAPWPWLCLSDKRPW